MGGGTLDWSLVELTTPEKAPPDGLHFEVGAVSIWPTIRLKFLKLLKVLAKAGENLGGADIDNWLVDYFQQRRKLRAVQLVQRAGGAAENPAFPTGGGYRRFIFNDETLETYEFVLESEPVRANF